MPALTGRAPLNNGKGDMRIVWRLLPYLWPAGEVGLRLRVVVAMVFLLLAKLVTVYMPIAFGQATDALAKPETMYGWLPFMMIAAYGMARIMSQFFTQARDAIFARVGMRAVRQLALSVFQHLHALSLRFHLNRQTGSLSRVIDRGNTAIQTLLSFALFNIFPTLLELLLVFVILWVTLDLWFALVTLATIIVYIVFTLMITEWRTRFRRDMNDADNKAGAKSVDALLNYETVKYFSNESHEASRYDQSLHRYEDAAVRASVSLAYLNFGQALIIAIGVSILMMMAARGIQQGQMSLGDFVMVNSFLLQIYQPLNFLGMAWREIKQALVDLEMMFGLLGEAPEVVDKPGAPDLRISNASIEFRQVSFAYDPRRPILHDISFTVPGGSSLAIVGPSGSGKSTITRLLFRFFDVGNGSIRIDDQDIRDINQQSLRRNLGIVPQDTVLFNDSISYNINYGKVSASATEVLEAARLARIDQFIASLPDGGDTTVGERGLKLSGGEKQRVAIARSVLKNPAIFVFDEATSALDTATERAIQSNLEEVSQGRTRIMIAHRLSTVVNADQIIVLNDGRISERGNHHELLALNGEYARLWQEQAKDSEDA